MKDGERFFVILILRTFQLITNVQNFLLFFPFTIGGTRFFLYLLSLHLFFVVNWELLGDWLGGSCVAHLRLFMYVRSCPVLQRGSSGGLSGGVLSSCSDESRFFFPQTATFKMPIIIRKASACEERLYGKEQYS